MEWSRAQLDFGRTVKRRFGKKMTPAALAVLFAKHLGASFKTPPTAEDCSFFFSDTPPPEHVAATKLVYEPRTRNVLKYLREALNEVKDELTESARPFRKPVFRRDGLTPILCLSDLHFGEVVEVDGQILYDMDIAERSFNSIIEAAIHAPELNAYDVDHLVVLLAGDIVHGELIYPAQSFESTTHALDQVKDALKIIYAGILRLSEVFPSIEVRCVPGNHGRASHLHHAMTNWDNLLYFALQMMVEVSGTKDITVWTPHQMWMDFTVRDLWNIHTRHIGVVQTASAGPGRKVQTWLESHDADLFFYGHYHNPEMFTIGASHVFKNGGLPPLSDYAEKLGFQEGVGQWLVGVTDTTPLAFSKILIPNREGPYG